ncbi:TfoX/Sxy family protein [Mesorhizobium sp. M00.F.Ca.ET.216.01.1.1]|uniref:TfoX/Sxy family protein n=1 Tax=Mesorhizobium sp. M00.F.Ca.ET.216.01.1.1 TaxID=2500528 RepID=UPI000FDBE040|nr:TfoX/Sxy family protein [Mesorhizobium sp. M00.F.Ca.ET.216.01.1.1]TGQ31263.1 TfoX family protein [Mesorhizobium sp. M00.F.Ca.ET.216.01.1.1]TJW09362.1 MAG: TfoX/Sxy family protein [Mesorhizobium sp.]TJW38173.1 MAG: TfoX/Sxy family protein [Mesorhizobium sp.]
MTADELATSVRAALAGAGDIREVKMFGGTGFMLNGNMVAGASRRGLLVRVGKDRQHGALAWPGAHPMEMRGRMMDGYIYVDPPALTDEAVGRWLQTAIAFVQTLPPKLPGEKPAQTKGKRK